MSVFKFTKRSIVFVWFVYLGFFRTTREFFTHIAGEWLQILTYARHLWPLSNEGSLVCHTPRGILF